MCGIVGQYSFASAAPVDPGVMAAMRDAMAHRGPDGSGLWLSQDRKVGLGHRRLAIVDLSEAAAQPMANEDGTVLVTFNGEIYNHQALRAQLLSKHRFQTDHCDTEVIVHGYEEWGIDGLVARIEGDFGIGLWDGRERTLHLIRDRIGVKPVYFSVPGGVLLFASEIKALMKHPALSPALEPAAMEHYLTFMTAPAPLTMFRGVYKLPAGYYLKVDSKGHISSRRYWHPCHSGDSGTRALAADEHSLTREIRARLTSSIEKRMMADVPLGVLLSGGIDSSTNVALMSTFMTKPVETFTVGFRDHPQMNEFEQARQIARAYRTNHHEVMVDEHDMRSYLDELVHTQDEPIADWVCIPLYFVSKLAHDNAVKVVQVGEGSDEQFAGYRHYLKYYALHRFFWTPFGGLPSGVRKGVATAFARIADVIPRFALHSEFVQRAAQNRDLFWSGAAVYWDSIKAKLIGHRLGSGNALDHSLQATGLFYPGLFSSDTHAVVKSINREFDAHCGNSDYLARMIYSELSLRLPELLLMRVDKVTMSVSLEARVPYLDHHLVELTMGVPAALRIRRWKPKYLLRKAVEGLIPSKTIQRKKVGFDAPMSKWLRGEFGREVESKIVSSYLVKQDVFRRDFVRQLFLDHRSGRERAIHIWVLFNLTEWFRYWIE